MIPKNQETKMTGKNERFEDVLRELVLEETKPTYAALVRWCERYPQHREALERFYAAWEVQEKLPERHPIDEERLAARSVKYALEILRRQGLGSMPAEQAEADTAKSLGPLEQLILTAIHRLGSDSYVESIANKAGELAGTSVMMRSVLEWLSRLESRGLVQSSEPDSASRRYFKVTSAGERALAESPFPFSAE
jgi:DNA-binding MarR family transcriptional regulator